MKRSHLKSVLSILKAKEEELKTTKQDLIDDITELKKTLAPEAPLEANIFVGKKGLRILFEEILETKKPVSLLGAELQFQNLFGPYFELWHKKRIEKKIEQRTIFPKKLKTKVRKRKLLQYKFIDNRFTNPTTTILYGDNCLLIQWSNEPIAMKIQNKEITKSHLNYFNILWGAQSG